MMLVKNLSCLLVGAMFCGSLAPQTAEAGPLLDWLRGCRRKCAQPACATPVTYAGQPVANCGLQPGQCQVTCNQTCSRVVVNYVPYTAYRTAWEQVPVTQYKPVTNADPCTGCTVTCMKPCTSYVWQMKQVPYTTYRPCYRTENYTVPVSYVTNDCATGNCATGNCATGLCPTGNCGVSGTMMPTAAANGCATCGVPQVTYANGQVIDSTGSAATGSVYYNLPANGNLPATANPTPADSVPAIQGVNPQSMQRPVLEQLQASPAGSSFYTPPQPVQPNLQTRQNPAIGNESSVARQEWGYSPVRLAAYARTEANPSSEIRGSWQSQPAAAPVNSGWQTAGW